MNIINSFQGEYRFLSNFYITPIIINGKEYASVEHWYQSEKSSDQKQKEQIRLAPTPGVAKRMGSPKGISNFKIILRPDWDIIQIGIMLAGIDKKFDIPEMKNKLIKTGDSILIEGNTWHDNFWGSCSCENCKKYKKHNILGGLLMGIRSRLR